MSFNENVRLDTSQVESGGSRRAGGGAPGGLVVGGGLGGIIVLIIAMIFGISPSDLQGGPTSLDPGQVSAGGSQSTGDFAQCTSGADANTNDTCLVIATVNSVQAYWSALFAANQRTYTPAKTVIYAGSTQSACGTASNQVGPFYCPLDKKVYIDASFFQLLQTQFGADRGNLAKEYVVAHEYGHHIQDELGLLDRAQQDPQGPQSGSVRTELMADCLAGVWAQHAASTKDALGVPFLKGITQEDLTSALSAAKSVGDDHIQSTMGSGRVNPESWTHGSAAARQEWFLTGYQTGDVNQCDTFSAATVE